jgi:hypothetical protein
VIRRALLAVAAFTLLLANPAVAQTTVPGDDASPDTTVRLPPSLLFGIVLMMVPLVAAVYVLYRFRRSH